MVQRLALALCLGTAFLAPAAAFGTIDGLGQHTEHVLRDHLGYTDDEISELAAAGALT